MFRNGLRIPPKEVIKEWICFVLFILFGAITCIIIFPFSVVSYLLRVREENKGSKQYYKIDDNIRT